MTSTQWPTNTFVDRAYAPNRLPPGMYQRNRVPITGMDALQRTAGSEVDELWNAIKEVEREMNPSTAASWGLDWWEATLLLPTDSTLSVSDRQDRLVRQLQSRFVTLSYPEWVARELGDPVAPSVIFTPWSDFAGHMGGPALTTKRGVEGWPGDDVYARWNTDIQNHSGAIHAAVAPWNRTSGLLPSQANQIPAISANELSAIDVNGPL